MYNNENVKWFNQTLMSFKDKRFATDGYLRLSLVTSTDNYKYFNPPIFSISISNNYQKSCSLNIQNAEDLLESIRNVIKQSNGHESVIEKRYTKNMTLYFKFTLESSNQERVIVIEMISSETDSAKVIIPLKPTFQTFMNRLKYFVSNYDDICTKLLLESTKSEMYEIINQLPNLIKGVSSQIIQNEDSILDSGAPAIDSSQVSEREATINDLDKFLGDDMSNIKIPEIEEGKIEEEKVTDVEIKSDFVNNVLKNDLSVLENKLTSFAVSEIPLLEVANELSSELGIKILPDLPEDELKSMYYLSTSFYQKFSKDYTVNDNVIPMGIPVIKFHCSNNDENITNLAYDLFLIIGYARTIRRRLEGRLVNAFDNKAMFYLLVRCFLDPFCFSYLDTNKDLVNIILNRYKSYKKQGFFEKYDNMLTNNNCSKIDETDIKGFVEELMDHVKKDVYVLDLHDTLYNSNVTKLPSKNTFELEQIIKEIVPLEVAERTGLDFKDKEVIDKFISNNNISDEIFKWYTSNKKATVSKTTEKITPLQKWIKKFIQDVPERYRDEVLETVKKLQYNNFDFSSCTWELEEFDENIIKALYLWNPENDSKMKTNLTYFETIIDNEVMTKENILTITKEADPDPSYYNNGFDFSNLSID